jgi:hypothetical protein
VIADVVVHEVNAGLDNVVTARCMRDHCRRQGPANRTRDNDRRDCQSFTHIHPPRIVCARHRASLGERLKNPHCVIPRKRESSTINSVLDARVRGHDANLLSVL